MRAKAPVQVKPEAMAGASFTAAPTGLLQRQCACGGTSARGSECEECGNKRLTLQHRAAGQVEPTEAPPIVHEALGSPGQPLDPGTRAFFEPRFGHDFGRVRVHTDAQAAKSARAVNALAYTVGRDVVFGEGQYGPGTAKGRSLLAHELAHTIQQGNDARPLQNGSGQVSSASVPTKRPHPSTPSPHHVRGNTWSCLEMTRPGDASEQGAEQAAGAVMAGRPFSLTSDSSRVARQAEGGVKPVLKDLAEMISRAAYRAIFRYLNGQSMPVLLDAMATLDREGQLGTLIQHADEARGYNKPRLELVMDVVKLKHRGKPVTDADKRELKERATAIELPGDQRDDVLRFLGLAVTERREKQAATVSASAKGSGGVQGAIPAEQLSAVGTEEQTAFKRQVYNAQMKRAMRVKTFFPGLPAEEMEVVEKGQRMRKDAAQACRELLEQARADLKQEQDEGDELAQKVTSIGVGSAYRDPTTDFRIWDGLFQKYYDETHDKRAELDGGEHGDNAVQYLAAYISQYKAVAGFSNHSSGIAVDFVTTEGKETLGANKSQNPRWKKSWLHKWLVEHAATLGFQPLATEAWHWDFRGAQDGPGRPDTG